jgi:long-chain fatty acid transport protein
MTFNKLAIALAVAGFSTGAYATNGMNMEGYGPVATSMGGASFAYDNGTAAMANNPATLGLMTDGSHLDLALGVLQPDVKIEGGQKSGGDSYLMPAVGWVKKGGKLTYGVGLFAQGGMGTEYTGMDGQPDRSELGVGRVIFPLAFQATPDLVIGGSIDFVWAMLDMRMAMPLQNMFGLITAPGNGTIAGAVNQMAQSGYYSTARLDFSDNNDFTGKARGFGYAGKLGLTYKASPIVTIGAVYESKTSLGDLKTPDTGASMVVSGTGPTMTIPGKITVKDFQWPEMYGLGVSVQATPALMVAADVKHIGWSGVMKNFTMNYSTMGDTVTFVIPQNWKDQTVVSLGLAYKATNALTLRAGANLADNPVPDNNVNYLFPAIVKNHYTVGLGYAFDPSSEVNVSLVYAPKVSQTGPNIPNMSNPGTPGTITHSQTNWQIMYSHKF